MKTNKHLIFQQIKGLQTNGFDFSNWEKLSQEEKQILFPYACGVFNSEDIFKVKKEDVTFNEMCLGFAVNNTLENFKIVKELSGCKLTKGVFSNCMDSLKIEYIELFGEETVKEFLDSCLNEKDSSFAKSVFLSVNFFEMLYVKNFISDKFLKFIEKHSSLMTEGEKKRLLRLKLMTI